MPPIFFSQNQRLKILQRKKMTYSKFLRKFTGCFFFQENKKRNTQTLSENIQKIVTKINTILLKLHQCFLIKSFQLHQNCENTCLHLCLDEFNLDFEKIKIKERTL